MLRQGIETLIEDLDSTLRKLCADISEHGAALTVWAQEAQQAADANLRQPKAIQDWVTIQTRATIHSHQDDLKVKIANFNVRLLMRRALQKALDESDG